MTALATLTNHLSDWRWRLSNLYSITDKRGQSVPFRPNQSQVQFLDGLHSANVILKARQLGFSTLIDLMLLDACLFNSDQRAGIIAHSLPDAEMLFRDKVRYPYDHLPDQLKEAIPATQDASKQLSFANGSSIRVGTSMRSGTLQWLHVSEYGKICAKYPDKAREIRTGALNTVEAGQFIAVESTAEGQEGHFYEMCEEARTLRDSASPLTPIDFKFHFFPWWQDDSYRMKPVRPFTQEEREYFDRLEREDGISLDNEQRAWYAAKWKQQGDDMRREYPSTPEEAFAASIEGAYYARQFIKIDEEQRICQLPVREEAKVDTWWDLGMSQGNEMAIWFVQRDGPWFNVLDYYENTGEGLAHYADVLNEKRDKRGFRYGRHIWPHDGSHRVLDEYGRKRTEIMTGLGYSPEIVERGDIMDGIEATRDILSSTRFDSVHCQEGIKRLRHYRREWDEDRGIFKSRPFHDKNSNGADAFRTGAMAKREDHRPDWSKPAYRKVKRV